MDEQTLKEKVRAELSEERFQHTCGVVETSATLAGRFGEDIQRARVAAWIHDIAREWDHDRLQQMAEQIEIPAGFAAIPALLHGPIAACLATTWFGVDDTDIQNAVRYHTTGREGMSTLEKILCLADAIEPGRRYPGVDHIRELAERDLDTALAESLDSTILYLIKTHQPVFPLTVMARNSLWERVTANRPGQ